MADRLIFEDAAGTERLIGTLHDPAATTGQVLTVQADKSIAAAAVSGAGYDIVGPVAVAFNDPNFETGIAIAPMNPGDLLVWALALVDTTFDNEVAGGMGFFAGTQSPGPGIPIYLNGGTLDFTSLTGGDTDTGVPTSVTDGLSFALTAHTLVICPISTFGGSPSQGAAGVYLAIARGAITVP